MNYNKLSELYNNKSISDEEIFAEILKCVTYREDVYIKDLYGDIKIISNQPQPRIMKKRINRINHYLTDIYNKNEIKRNQLNDLLNFKLKCML